MNVLAHPAARGLDLPDRVDLVEELVGDDLRGRADEFAFRGAVVPVELDVMTAA